MKANPASITRIPHPGLTQPIGVAANPKGPQRLSRKNMDLRLELRRTSKLAVTSPKGDSVSVGFLSRHYRAGLWILPSFRGLVYGKKGGSSHLS
jgi:hypothetical protein